MSPARLESTMTMGELLQAYPGAQRALFRHYHIGGCSACGFQPDETLAAVCQRNGQLNAEDVIAQLEASRNQDAELELAPLALRDALDSATPPRVLDIRTREEWDAVHIEGSEFFTQETLQTAMSEWDRDALLVIVDHHGGRSADAAAYFQGHGFSYVRTLRGGIDAYSREAAPGLPRYTAE